MFMSFKLRNFLVRYASARGKFWRFFGFGRQTTDSYPCSFVIDAHKTFTLKQKTCLMYREIIICKIKLLIMFITKTSGIFKGHEECATARIQTRKDGWMDGGGGSTLSNGRRLAPPGKALATMATALELRSTVDATSHPSQYSIGRVSRDLPDTVSTHGHMACSICCANIGTDERSVWKWNNVTRSSNVGSQGVGRLIAKFVAFFVVVTAHVSVELQGCGRLGL